MGDIWLVKQIFGGKKIETDDLDEAARWILADNVWSDENLAKNKPTAEKVKEALKSVPSSKESLPDEAELPGMPFVAVRWPFDYRSKQMSSKFYKEGACKQESACPVAGFQVPMSIRQRKQKVDELLEVHDDLDEGHALSFFSGLDEAGTEVVCKMLDAGDVDGVADRMRSHAIRELVKKRIKEIVRRKPGGGGWVLYSPNKGKKKAPKPVGTFPTRLGAKRAELARFPPKDPEKLRRLRKSIDKMLKDPKKRDKMEKDSTKKDESSDIATRAAVSHALCEALFYEERADSMWDDVLSKMPEKVKSGDKALGSLQKKIEKKTDEMLKSALRAISRAVVTFAKVKDLGIKRSESGSPYIAFDVDLVDASVGPIAVYIDKGVPKIEMSSQAKQSLLKADPDDAKRLRAELITVQEGVLDEMDDLTNAIEQRDEYLNRIENEIDRYVSSLSPMKLMMLKTLIAKKYRRLS